MLRQIFGTPGLLANLFAFLCLPISVSLKITACHYAAGIIAALLVPRHMPTFAGSPMTNKAAQACCITHHLGAMAICLCADEITAQPTKDYLWILGSFAEGGTLVSHKSMVTTVLTRIVGIYGVYITWDHWPMKTFTMLGIIYILVGSGLGATLPDANTQHGDQIHSHQCKTHK